MKKLFDKSNFSLSSFDKAQKRQSLVVSLLVIVSYVVSAFIVMDALYALADIVGCFVSSSPDVAIKDALRSIPLFLVFFMSVWTIVLFHATFRRTDETLWKKKVLRNSYTIIAFAAVTVIYVIVGLICGKYSSLVEGSPSAIYPLDTVLYSLVYAAIGVVSILYVTKYKDKYPYVVPTRSETVKKVRFVYCFALTFFLIISLFGFSGGVYSIFIYDFAHEYAFYGVGLVLAYLSSPIILGVWEFYYNELKEEKKKELLLPLSLISTGVSVVVTIIFFVSLAPDYDAPSNRGFGILPVAFAASVNIATLIVVFLPVIFSLVALVKGLILKFRKQ